MDEWMREFDVTFALLIKYLFLPSEEFDLTKMSWGDHDILTVTSHDYLTATLF